MEDGVRVLESMGRNVVYGYQKYHVVEYLRTLGADWI